MNKSLKHYLRAFAADKLATWVEWLPLAEVQTAADFFVKAEPTSSTRKDEAVF